MTLTVCVGSSGSGKTTFLEDVHKSHKCTYIRQYHMMRPYIKVTQIPHFDATKLPFWETYVREGKADTIMVGGTMAGKFVPGFSGGQRKLLLFELIYQRTADQKDLLIVLDEPFAGVTDDYVPFIKQRLEELQKRHNVLLVTNDHVEALKRMADNIITVSAIDRSVVKINDRECVPRDQAIMALSIGDKYVYESDWADYQFFFDVEVKNTALLEIAVFATFTFSLFIATFWNSKISSSALVLIAGGMIAFFSVNPYLLALVEWRNSMLEEAEALVHASKGANRTMKLLLTLLIIIILSAVEFGVVNAVIGSEFSSVKFWIAMLFDSASVVLPLACLGLFTRFSFQTAQILGTLPFLLMIFLSTTFSPGAGVDGLKELRYLFTRYYFWCMVPSVQNNMEACPDSSVNLLYLILSAFLPVGIIFTAIRLSKLNKSKKQRKLQHKHDSMMSNADFQDLQVSMYGAKALRRFKNLSEHGSDSGSLGVTTHLQPGQDSFYEHAEDDGAAQV